MAIVAARLVRGKAALEDMAMKKIPMAVVLAVLVGGFWTAAATEFNPDLCREYTITVHNVSRWHIRANIVNRVSDGPPARVHAVMLGLDHGESKTQTFTNCTGEWNMLMTASEPSDYNTPLKKFLHFSTGSGYTLKIDDRAVATWPAKTQEEEAQSQIKAEGYDKAVCQDERPVKCVLFGSPNKEVLARLEKISFRATQLVVFICDKSQEEMTKKLIGSFGVANVKYYVGCIEEYRGRPPEWNAVVVSDKFTNR